MMGSKPKRKSIGYFASHDDPHADIPKGHAFLLARDIPLGIVPYELRRGTSSFDVKLEPASAERTAWLTELLSTDGRGHSLQDALTRFVDDVANHMGYFGEVCFELIFDDGELPVKLAAIAHERLVRLPCVWIQRIPKADRDYLERGRFVVLPGRNVWRLTMPRRLGTPRAHRRLLRRLESMSSTTSGIALRAFEPGHKSFGYDVTAHHSASERSEERATQKWGTVPSMQRPVGDSTEYFYISRRLAFLEAQAALREHIFSQVNDFLKRLGVEERLVVTGLPSAVEIHAAQSRLQNGKLTLSEALDEASGTVADEASGNPATAQSNS